MSRTLYVDRLPVSPAISLWTFRSLAASVLGADLVGVDQLPDGDGFTVIELNGAVTDFACRARSC